MLNRWGVIVYYIRKVCYKRFWKEQGFEQIGLLISFFSLGIGLILPGNKRGKTLPLGASANSPPTEFPNTIWVLTCLFDFVSVYTGEHFGNQPVLIVPGLIISHQVKFIFGGLLMTLKAFNILYDFLQFGGEIRPGVLSNFRFGHYSLDSHLHNKSNAIQKAANIIFV